MKINHNYEEDVIKFMKEHGVLCHDYGKCKQHFTLLLINAHLRGAQEALERQLGEGELAELRGEEEFSYGPAGGSGGVCDGSGGDVVVCGGELGDDKKMGGRDDFRGEPWVCVGKPNL